MTLLRRGIKRLSALFCTALLLLHLGAYPLCARATAGTLAAVAGVTVLGAYLMASGVYPYISEAGQSLSEWTSDTLQPLLDKYNAYLVSIGKSYQITLQGGAPTIKGYLTQGVICVANDTWAKLRELVQWIQSEYALADNQTGVQLGEFTSGFPELYNYTGGQPSKQFMLQNGTYVGLAGSAPYYVMAWNTIGATCAMNVSPYGGYELWVLTKQKPGGGFTHPWRLVGDVLESATYSLSERTWTYGGNTYTYYVSRLEQFQGFSDISIPAFDSFKSLMMAYFGIDDTMTTFVGVHADTTTVAPLESLPADAPWGGLAVEGVGAAASPTIVDDVIGGAIAEREKPAVIPVTIDVEAGTDVDTETGEIMGDGTVTITSADIPLVSTDYQIPGLSNVFPFSLPWDIYRIYNALNAEPVRPEWDVTVYVPVLEIQAPMHIGFPEDLAPVVDNFMSLARKLILILLCVLTLIGVRNLIR